MWKSQNKSGNTIQTGIKILNKLMNINHFKSVFLGLIELREIKQ